MHLVEEPLPKNKWEAQDAVTQAGISAAVYVQRKHVPRTLKRLGKVQSKDDVFTNLPEMVEKRLHCKKRSLIQQLNLKEIPIP